MENLHPAIVHFPIALLFLAGLFGLISIFWKREFWKDIAVKCLFIGTIFAPIAVLTGLQEEQSLKHNEAIHEILVKHKANGLIILSLSLILSLWYWFRRKNIGNKEYSVWAVMLFLGSILVIYQRSLGGEMVYGHGAGVKPKGSEMEDHSGYKQGSEEKNGENKEEIDHQHSKKDTSATKHDDGKQEEMKKDSIVKKKQLKDMKY